MFLIGIVSLSFAIGLFLLNILIPYLRKYSPDIPNQRSSHKEIKPRGGGIVFVCLSAFSTIYHGNLSYILSIPLSVISFVDDKFNVSAKYRFIVQFVSCYLILLNSPFKTLNIPILNIYKFDYIVNFLVVLSGTTIINFSNFMDGIDGLLAGCYFITIATVMFKFNIVWLAPLLGALLAFLKFNWAPSKIFMGDIGSTFLGIIFYAAILHVEKLSDKFCIILIMSPIFIDAFFTLMRRLLNNQNIFSPHKLHLYQRLVQNSWAHGKVSGIYILGSVLISFSYLIYGFNGSMISFSMVSVFMIYLNNNFANSFHIK